MSELTIMKKKAELARVRAGRAEYDFKICEHMENIERIKREIVLQDETEQKLLKELEELTTKKEG